MTIKRHRAAILAALLLMCLRGIAAAAQEPAAIIAGTVSIAGPDGQPMVLPGVTITLACKNAESRTEVSDEQGEFRFADAGADADARACSIVADLQGFKSVAKAVALKPGETTAVTMQLGLDTLREEVVVSAKIDPADGPVTARVERMTAQIMRTAPIASERFQDAL